MPETSELNKSLGKLEQELSNIKSASEMITDAKETTNKTINETKIIIADLIENSKKASDSAIRESKKLNESATKLFKAVALLMQKLDKVDFPTRLDKLDSSVSGINTAIQNIFGRFETVEKNLKDEFNYKISGVQEKLEKSQKLNLVFLVLILLFTGSSLLTILVKFVF